MFKYASWWNAMIEYGIPRDDVYVHHYTPDFSAMKFSRKGEAEPFLHRGMVAKEIPQDHPLMIKYQEDFQYGGYIVQAAAHTHEDQEKKHKKKELYVVNIVKHIAPFSHGNTMFTADHLSFLINHSVRLKLQMHRTSYAGGRADAIENHLPLQFSLKTVQEFTAEHIHKQRFSPYTDALYDVITMLPSSSEQQQVGGKSKKRKTRRQVHVESFDDIWWNLPIRFMRVFVVPTPGGNGTHDISVYAIHRLQRDRDLTDNLAFFRRVPSLRAQSEPELRRIIGEMMTGITPEDFEVDDAA
jgi:hypothetical protein